MWSAIDHYGGDNGRVGVVEAEEGDDPVDVHQQ
jgi:hypothetical protein